MNKTFRNQILKHALVIAGFIAITMIYFSPLLQNKELKQGDVDHWYGAAKEILDFRKAHNTEPLWTNSMFGGMPAYQISVLYPSNLVQYINKVITLGIPTPANFFFLYFLGFYILLLVLKIDWRLAALGSLAFGLSSYFLIIIEAGHNTKAEAVGYMAPVIAGIILTYRGKYFAGGALTALAMALEINANHPQVTYYLFLIISLLVAVQIYKTWQEKAWKSFVIGSGIIAAVTILAVLTSVTSLWATADYGKYSTRGQSELAAKKVSTGLDRDYVFDWSYGNAEAWTLLIPNYKGGSSSMSLGKDESVIEKVNPNYRKNIEGFPSYWGDQQFTSGPVYVGAIVCFLFLLGLLICEGTDRWWLLAGTILSIFLAWGKNFPAFNYFLFDHLPGYNKFRAVTIALVIAEFCMPVLAILALNKVLNTPNLLQTKKRNLFIGMGVALGITLIVAVSPTIFSDVYKTEKVVRNGQVETVGEYEQLKGEIKKQGANDQQAADFLENLEIARKAVLSADAWRSFIFIALACALIFGYEKYKFKKEILLLGMGILIVSDLWAVDKRFLNDDDFKEVKNAGVPFEPKKVDLEILKDQSPDYRVMNLQNPFNDARTSYFHKSIGGYHGAKLKKIKELIDYRLDPEVQMIIGSFKSKDPRQIDQAMANAFCINMLNGKYIIYNEDAPPIPNQHALGNCWFIRDFRYVANADSEINAMGSFDPAKTAVVDERYKPMIDNFHPNNDTTGTIKLNSYQPNDLIYQSNSTTEQLAIFSEIFFEGGWNAYIDGKLTPHFRADYVLRGMKIPAGSHRIEFKFEPSLYSTGEHISLASSLILLLLVGGAFFILIKEKLKEPEPVQPVHKAGKK